MSNHGNNGKSPKPELMLNLSLLPRGESSTQARMEADDDDGDDDSPNSMSISSSSGQSLSPPPSSCVSSEDNPEASTSMVLAGCPHCLMYVMLSEDEEPKCPKCKNAVLLDFVQDKNKNKSGKS